MSALDAHEKVSFLEPEYSRYCFLKWYSKDGTEESAIFNAYGSTFKDLSKEDQKQVSNILAWESLEYVNRTSIQTPAKELGEIPKGVQIKIPFL